MKPFRSGIIPLMFFLGLSTSGPARAAGPDSAKIKKSLRSIGSIFLLLAGDDGGKLFFTPSVKEIAILFKGGRHQVAENPAPLDFCYV